MKIEFLGSGTSQGVPVIACECPVCTSSDPKNRRLRCALSIQIQQQQIIIDIGPDFRTQILRAGITTLDALFITHEHNDHTAGLDDVRPFNFKYKKDIPVYASKKVQEDLTNRFHYAFSVAKYPGAPKLTFHTISHLENFQVGEINVIPILLDHGNMPVLGFRIDNFTYLTDAKRIEEGEIKKIEGTEILVVNALQKEKHFSHFTLSEAIELAERIGAKQTYFTHISHRMGLHEEVSKELPANIYLAYDGLKLDLDNLI